MKKILLVYGQALSHSALRELLHADQHLLLAEEVGSGREAVAMLRQQAFDVVILDVSSPEKNGLELFCDLKQAAPTLPILIINGSEHPARMMHFVRLGCTAYLPYTTASALVVPTLLSLSCGRVCLLSHQQTLATSQHHLPHERLSLRELQVYFKLIKGQTVNAVANELAIAPGSVSVFRSKILKKMHMPNNAALIQYALEHQLMPLTGGDRKPATASA